MKLLFILLLLPFGLSAQQCWQCLAYAERDMSAEVLTTCRAAANTSGSKQERSVAQLVLARQYMNDAAYSKAIPLLDSVRTSGIPWLSWMAGGLKADCLLDKGKPLAAAALYEETANTCGNDHFAPYYLFKAGKIWSVQKKPKQAYIAFKTIKNTYQPFAQQQSIDLYIDQKLDKELALNEPRTPLKLPASPMGPGYVMGEKVDPAVLQKATDYIVGQELSYLDQTGQVMTEYLLQQANDRAWQYYTESVIVRKMLSEAGVQKITPEELHAYLFGENGYPVMPDVAANFTDPTTGRLDKGLLQRFIDEMQARNDGQWQTIEQALKDQLQFEKFYKLMGLGIFVTRWEGEYDYMRTESLIRATVTFQRYRSVDEDKVSVSEKELQDYYQQHIGETIYDRPAGKEMHVVHITALPRHEDTLALYASLESLKAEWKKAASDSLFMDRNGAPESYHLGLRPETDPMAVSGMTFPVSMESAFTSARPGDIIGPYIDGESVCLARVSGFNSGKISARHILIGSRPWEDSPQQRIEKRQLAERLLKEVNRANFSAYVDRYTDDPGSKSTGGTYEDFLATDMVKPFGDYCATAPIGKIGLVETDYGFHIIEVLSRGKGRYPICSIIRKQLQPDEGSAQRAQQMAEDLMQQYHTLSAGMRDNVATLALFDSLANAAAYSSRLFRIEDRHPTVNGFPEASVDDVFRALYGKEAAVGNTFITRDGNEAVLAIISSIHDGGAVPYESVRDILQAELEDERRAAVLTDQVKGLTSVNDIAATWGTTVDQREMSQMNPAVLTLGYQPEVVGTVFREGKPGMLFVLPGNGGVCAIRINEKSAPAKRADYEDVREQLQFKAQSMLQPAVHSAFRNQIIDNRRLDALGLR